jgi:protein-S-isoprenylcysteine O-methyltransferase Ste14
MSTSTAAAWASSPRRSFVLIPLAAALGELMRRRSPFRGGAPGIALLAVGYGLYRAAGRHRAAQGGGGPGFAARPDRLVTTGPYAVVRNPMYLGHLLFLGGLVVLTRSPVALAGLAIQWQRLAKRARMDERRLADQFGHDYAEYVETVPRWLPLPASLASPYVLFHRIAEPASARIRSRVVELGLKSTIDFLNAETDGKDELARLGGAVTPALWDGRSLTVGEAAVALKLAAMQPEREDGW